MVENLCAVGQVETNLDLCIAMLVQRKLVDIEEDPQGPLNSHQIVLMGTVELGRVPMEKGQV
ncbi:MAG: hypothetical protein ACKPKO_30760, partial [Candidatus Fonsibacter sp.]